MRVRPRLLRAAAEQLAGCSMRPAGRAPLQLELDGRVYAAEPVLAAVRRFLLRSPKSQLQILIQDESGCAWRQPADRPAAAAAQPRRGAHATAEQGDRRGWRRRRGDRRAIYFRR